MTLELDELLWKTLEVFRDHGGGKGENLDVRTGKVCLVGALGQAITLLGVHPSEVTQLGYEAQMSLILTANELFPRRNQNQWYSATSFNDFSTTTKDMVEQVIEKTAMRATELVSSEDDREPSSV